MTRVLITGVNGFCGRHLANYLLTTQGVEVHGISRVSSSPREYRLPEPVSVSTLCPIILLARPDYVFHLAGVTAVEYDGCVVLRVGTGGSAASASRKSTTPTKVKAAVTELTRDRPKV